MSKTLGDLEPERANAPASELLIVDSDNRTLQLCFEMTQDLGLLSQTAETVDAVLDILEAGRVSVALLSEELAGGPDFELLRHIRYWYPETQGVLVAEAPTYRSAVESVKLGAVDYLPKPLEVAG